MDPLWSFLNGSSSPQGHLFASTCRPHAVTWCSSQDPSRTHEDVLWQLSHLWTQLGIMRPRRAGGTKTSGHTWGTGGRVPSPQCWLWVLCWGTRHSVLLILVEWGPLPRTHTTRAGAGGGCWTAQNITAWSVCGLGQGPPIPESAGVFAGKEIFYLW